MQPDPPKPPNQNNKQATCPITRQSNKYRNSLPQVARSQEHFFFKEVSQTNQEIAYVTIGYRIGSVPFALMDLFSVIINQIHSYAIDANIKIIMDGDQLWVTSTTGYEPSYINTHRFNVDQSDTNDALLKTRNILQELLAECDQNRFEKDSVILDKVRKKISKQIQLVFKNPHIDD